MRSVNSRTYPMGVVRDNLVTELRRPISLERKGQYDTVTNLSGLRCIVGLKPYGTIP